MELKKKDIITETILKMVALDKHANSYSRSLSGGMKRRLLIAKAMVHQPPILILDEPTAGVDVELRQNLWKNVKKLNELGVTILLTTHYLFEAQEMCDRIAIINKGNLVELNTTQKLLQKIKTKNVTINFNEKIENLEIIFKDFKIISKNEREVTISIEKKSGNFESLIEVIKKNNLKPIDITTDDGNLEDVFIHLTKG